MPGPTQIRFPPTFQFKTNPSSTPPLLSLTAFFPSQIPSPSSSPTPPSQEQHLSFSMVRGAMGKLGSNHLRQLRDIFSRFDMDSDGSLTLLELAALLRSLGLKPTGDQIHALLSSMDANGNGTVEFEELAAAIAPLMSEQTLVNQEQLLDVFRSFDRDGNGYISAAELARSMARMGQPLTFCELTAMMREADTNGDGVISFSEFTAVMAKSAHDFLGFAISS